MIKIHSLFKKYFFILTAVILLTAVAVSGVLLLVLSDMIFDKYAQIILTISVISVLIILVCAVVLYLMYRRIIKTLCQITSLVDDIYNEKFADKITMSGITEFYQLELALSDLSESLQESSKKKGQLVSNISHELRTPLTSISGFVDGIIDGTIPEDKQPHYLSLISQEVKRLARLTRLMLNLEQLESGAIKPVMTSTNVITIIVDVLNTFEKVINEKKLEILGLGSENVTIFADKDMIYQVIYNLIENAIKFTPENGYIDFIFRDDPSYNYISVKNSGEGLSEDEKAKVFNRFYKTASSRGNDTVGAGLGLNIVRSIISLHNGAINVDSIQNEYTQFTFSIPKQKN